MSEAGGSGSAASAAFSIESESPSFGVVVVRPVGDLDLFSAAELQRELLVAIRGRSEAMDGADVVVVDLETTSFIDSTTLGVLLAAGRRLKERGGALHIACADQNIRRIFEMTLLDRVFAIHASVQSALGPRAGA